MPCFHVVVLVVFVIGVVFLVVEVVVLVLVEVFIVLKRVAGSERAHGHDAGSPAGFAFSRLGGG